jgi:S-(hydroxymethyl)glutathione dehydrogenase / alcohol dehydrogenase
MRTMRAAVVATVPGTPSIVEVDVGEPGVGEVLVRTVAAGVCHSDLHAMHGAGMTFPTPFVLGHEPAGVVEAVGPGVRRFAPGDHVVACLSAFCGHCPRCVTGRSYQCFTDEFARGPGDASRLSQGGSVVHQFVGLGGFAEYMLVGQNNVVKIRDEMPLDRACLLGCGVLTGVGAALNTAQVDAGAKVAVIGAGGVGLSVIQGARIANASMIVAVDVDDTKLELASALGATATVNATIDDAVARVVELTGGGADFVFEAIGNAATVQQGLAMAGTGGVLTVVGIMDFGSSFTVTGTDLVMGKRIQQSLMGSNRFVADIPRLVDHYLGGRLDLDRLVNDTATLDDVPKVLDDLEAGRVLGRTVISFAGSSS